MEQRKSGEMGPTKGLKDQLTETLTKPEFLEFYPVSAERIRDWVENIDYIQGGFSLATHFESPGYGSNQTKEPEVVESNIDGSMTTKEHETRHSLHELVCQTLFEGEDAASYLGKFKETVLGDSKFVAEIEKAGGSKFQEQMLTQARELVGKTNLSLEDIHANAWLFGALTYQHAYMIDPGMCEAVASFQDRGVTLIIDEYNQWFAKLFIPGRQFFEGYANPEWQEKFKKADKEHKAMLVKSTDYKFETYWPS